LSLPGNQPEDQTARKISFLGPTLVLERPKRELFIMQITDKIQFFCGLSPVSRMSGEKRSIRRGTNQKTTEGKESLKRV
jgi:hypothetical protein